MKGAEDGDIEGVNAIMTDLFNEFGDPDEWKQRLAEGVEKELYAEGKEDVWDVLNTAWKAHGAALDDIVDYDGSVMPWWRHLSASPFRRWLDSTDAA